MLSYNKNAIDMLLSHYEKIDWESLSLKCHILEETPEKIDWESLSLKCHILEENP